LLRKSGLPLVPFRYVHCGFWQVFHAPGFQVKLGMPPTRFPALPKALS
jgi:hypothetical protein